MRNLIVALGILALSASPALAKKAPKRHKPAKHAKAKPRAHKQRHAQLDRTLMQPSWL